MKVLLSILWLAYGVTGCGTLGESDGDRIARQIWKKHEVDLRRAIEGQPRSDEVCEPCIFFEQVVGIQVHVNFFTLGYVPEPEAKDDLKRIEAWYRSNHHRLYWDEATGTVKVRPQPSEHN